MYKILLVCFICQTYGYIMQDGFDGGTRVIGGTVAPKGWAPYLASLRKFHQHFCGGAILNERWIMTANHCLENEFPYLIKVVVGTRLNIFCHDGDTYDVRKFIIHENYDSEDIVNDIGLVSVKTNIKFSVKVQTIALPMTNTGDDEELLLSGWGWTTHPGDYASIMHTIKLRTMNTEKCRRIYMGSSPVFDTQICTLNEPGEGACHGDSGSPLVVDNSVVGVVSWATQCAMGYPDVHSRVYSFKSWILKNISS